MSMVEAIRETVEDLSAEFGSVQLRIIEDALYVNLRNYILTKRDNASTVLPTDISPDARIYQMFFVAKKLEGLSEKSLAYYKQILKQFVAVIQKSLSTISTDDVRFYLANRQNISLTTINNERRVLLTFFTWLCNEEYIAKNPVIRIKNIKEPKVIKKPFTATEIEELRDACQNLRDRAMIETLLSTGMRCSELCGINNADVNFTAGEIIVTGKGNKQRICYLNASAKKRIKDYLDSRQDNYKPLFIGINDRGNHIKDNRLKSGGVETRIRNIGNAAGVDNTHPHRFRRTAATIALQRGMPIEQVQAMLGHEKIDTTMRYAITADETVKQSHAKYM